MRRFELVDGKSSKFWEIEVQGSEIHLRWGRIGTDGQTKTKTLSDQGKAVAESEKQIASKLKKGYEEVEGSSNGKATSAKAEASAPKPAAKPAPAPQGTPPKPQQQPPGEPSAPGSSSELPDESAPVLPDGWRRLILPRQGGGYKPTVKIVPPAKALELGRKAMESSKGPASSRWQVAKEAFARGEATLEEAADMGFALAHVKNGTKARSALIDFWVGKYDLALATAATMETDLLVERSSDAQPEYYWDYDYFYRMRTHLAVAEPDAYRLALQVAAERRKSRSLAGRIKAAFLFPTEDRWLFQDYDQAAYAQYPWMLATVSEPSVAAEIAQSAGIHGLQRGPGSLLPTFIDALGNQAGPILAHLVAKSWIDSDGAKALSRALASIPCEKAFETLLILADQNKSAAPALQTALQNFPRLALRVLSRRGDGQIWARSVLQRYPAIVEVLGPELDSEQLEYLDKLGEIEAAVPEAPSEACPRFLLDPPWQNRKPIKSFKLKLEPLPHTSAVSWNEGEREKNQRHRQWDQDLNLEEYFKLVPSWRQNAYNMPANIVDAPESAARQLLGELKIEGDTWYLNQHMPAIAARFGLEALRVLKEFANRKLADALPSFGPFDDAELCVHAAEAFGRLKSVRQEALAYLCRHPDTAALALLPRAFSKPSKERNYAEAALLALAGAGYRDNLLKMAAAYGAEEAVEALLGRDPLELLPKKMPSLPDWLEPSVGILPPPELADGSGALPEEALHNLLLMLAISKPDEVYAGVEMAADACTPSSLTRFAWELFELWLKCGSPSKDNWAFLALGWLGDDSVARRLTPLLKKWPGEGGHARAVQGLEVLTSIGSDVALMHLYGLSQKLKFKGLKSKAAEKVEQIAEERGLSTEQLGDRLVPDLDLDEDGSMLLDYGERSFTVGFDEHLKPYVLDQDGKRLKSLPKPGKRDHECAAEAYERFKALKKDVKTVAGQQLTRLELAMCKQRRWSAEDFRSFFLEHPLVIHLVRRLVWGVFDADDKLVASFRVAEDRSLADAEEEEWELPLDAVVGLPHRLELEPGVQQAWGEVFSDYELLQPFPQLSREVYAREPAVESVEKLELVKGIRIDTGKILGLTHRGWRRGEAMDGGVCGWMLKELHGGKVAYLNLDPGIAVGDPMFFAQQELLEVTLGDDSQSWDSSSKYSFGDISAVSYSELVRDLEPLRG